MGRVSPRAVSSWSRSPGGCGFRVFWVGRIFSCFFFFDFPFFLRTHTACCKYEATSCLIYLSSSIYTLLLSVVSCFPLTFNVGIHNVLLPYTVPANIRPHTISQDVIARAKRASFSLVFQRKKSLFIITGRTSIGSQK